MRFLIALLLAASLAGCASDPAGPDPATIDSDGDGFNDAVEIEAGSDPKNATSVPVVRLSETVSFRDTGMILAGAEDPTGAGCGASGDAGVAAWTWSITPPTGSNDAFVTELEFTATYPATMPEGDIYVFNPDGQLITGSTPVTVPPSATDRVTVDARQPAGDFRIEVRGCLGAGEVTMVASGVLSYLTEATLSA